MRHKAALKSSWGEARHKNSYYLIIIFMTEVRKTEDCPVFSTGVGGKKQCFLKIGGIVNKMGRLFQLFFFQ